MIFEQLKNYFFINLILTDYQPLKSIQADSLWSTNSKKNQKQSIFFSILVLFK